MASLTKTVGKRGTTWRIDFYLGDDPKRKHIRLGKVDKRQAESIKARVELLVAAKITGTAPDADTSRWVADREDELHAKLVKHGLAAPRGKLADHSLAALLDGYIAKRSDFGRKIWDKDSLSPHASLSGRILRCREAAERNHIRRCEGLAAMVGTTSGGRRAGIGR
jgi:hypothetical protein